MQGPDIDQKERVRRQIVDNFFEIDTPNQENQEILKKYLDDMLYLPDVMAAQEKPEPGIHREIQQEDEIVFQDELYKRPSFATRASTDGGNKNEVEDVTLNQIESV